MAVPDVFILVKSMNPYELRHFRQRAQRLGGREVKLYLQLFEVLHSLDEYSDGVVQSQLWGSPLLRQYAAACHQLYQQVLACLLETRERESAQAWIHARLDEAEVLVSRRMHKQALKILRRARKRAEMLELNFYLPEIYRRERALLKQRVKKDLHEVITMQEECEKQALFCLQQEMSLQHASDMLFASSQENIEGGVGYWRKHKKEVLQGLPVKRESQVRSFQGRLTFNLAHSFLLLLAGEDHKALLRQEHILELWHEAPLQIQNDPWRYALFLTECLKLSHLSGEYRSYPELVQKLKAVSGLTRGQQSTRDQNVNQLLLLYHLSHSQWREGLELEAAMEPQLRQQEQKDPNSWLSSCFNFSTLHFMMRDYKGALKWLNRILQMERTEVRLDVQRFAGFFHLIIHRELGNDDLVFSLMQNLRRNLSGRFSEFELALWEYLRSLVTNPGQSASLQQAFRKKLEQNEQWGDTEVGFALVSRWVG